MKKYLIIVLLGFNLISFGQNKTILESSLVTFKIKNAGIQVDGKFNSPKGTIIFDKKNLRESSFEVNVETKSINTGNNSRDGHLKKEEYFNVEHFPTISFKSTSIEANSNGYVAIGKLTIKGKTKEIKIPFTFDENGLLSTFKGSFSINRLDFTVGESSWILSDDVTIQLIINVSN